MAFPRKSFFLVPNVRYAKLDEMFHDFTWLIGTLDHSSLAHDLDPELTDQLLEDMRAGIVAIG